MSNFVLPAGTVLTYAASSIPAGFLACDGSQVSRTTYAALFAVVGTIHGNGNGSTTFHLPDYRGRFLRGWDNGATRDPDKASRTASNAGGATGDNVGSVQNDDISSHLHSTLSYRPGTGSAGSNFPFDSGARNFDYARNSGSTGGNETRPINAYVNYIIKY